MKFHLPTLVSALLLAGSTLAHAQQFRPNQLAVLRAGDGAFDLNRKQSPIFVDQFSPEQSNAAPTLTIAIPTNGAASFFFNGHAATEGTLTRSADQKLLTFAGYGGVNLLEVAGTASRLDIQRGYATLDRNGTFHSYLYKSKMTDAKLIPRGAATDGSNNFWACGNALGSFYQNPTNGLEPARFAALPNSRSLRLVEQALYAAINSADAYSLDQPAGIYRFLPLALPKETNTAIQLVIATAPEYKKIGCFDLNAAATIAYAADTAAGIQKYVKTGGAWKFAYNFAIPQNIPTNLNAGAGCFGLVVDFSASAPVIYATTTEGYGGAVNSNRVVRIVDSGANAPVVTLAQAGSTNIAFRGIDFTPK